MSELIVGRPVVIAVDPQEGGSQPGGGIPADMPGRAERSARMIRIVDRARELGVPVVFIQEVHKRDMVDIGRELEGAEGPHCIEDDPKNGFIDGLDPRPEEFHIRKRRYSAFFGTELEIVLKAYGAGTVILFGGLTDVCVHYTAVDAHQHDYRVRVATDAVGGSTQRAHDAALEAIEYLQSDALATTDELIAAMERAAAEAAAA
ncbi:MAG: cysteine hydrolase [Actinobacteria bacterium]|nr:cysteine hydrolase [Actinomycetota bacterium]